LACGPSRTHASAEGLDADALDAWQRLEDLDEVLAFPQRHPRLERDAHAAFPEILFDGPHVRRAGTATRAG
jgi:hypothetical protein